MAAKPWKHFDCSKAKNSAHIAGLHAAVGALECNLRKVYLVNLDGDNIITPDWLKQCLERAMVEWESLMIDDWCDEVCSTLHGVAPVWGVPPLTAWPPSENGVVMREFGMTAPNVSNIQDRIPFGTQSGSQWFCKEMGTSGRIGMPAVNFILVGGHDEDLLGMGLVWQ